MFRIVFKHNPLPFHKDAPLAAQAGIAAGKQGKFWPMHDIMFKNMKKLKQADLEGYASSLGLNMAKFKTDLNAADVKAQVKADMAVARQFGPVEPPISSSTVVSSWALSLWRASARSSMKSSRKRRHSWLRAHHETKFTQR